MFDPYRKWLGIPPRDQPPHHYRLLGIELFESDLDVIEGAFDKQMSFVRQYQSGEYATDAARILNELATARLCLLKPTTKAAYDEKLRKQLTPIAAEPEFPDLPFSDDAPRLKSRKKKSKSSSSKSAVPPHLLLIGGGAAVVCILFVAFLMRRGGRQPAGTTQESTTVSAAIPAPLKRDVAPTQSAPISDASANSFLWQETMLVTEPAGPTINLLEGIDLNRDVVLGNWEQTSTALIGDRNSRIYLPVRLPEDYQLKFKVRRTDMGRDPTLQLGFMMGGRYGTLVLDGWEGAVSGLYVDGRDPNDNCTTRRGKLFQDSSQATIVLTVHPTHFQAMFDERTVVDWFGEPKRLFSHSAWALPCRESPNVVTSDAKFVIESASMIPIKPEPEPLRLARLDRIVDVLPLMDQERDVHKGIWGVTKNALLSPDGTGFIYLPMIVPEEYTLSATVELPREFPGFYGFAIGLIAEKSSFQIASTLGDGTGLDMIDERRWTNNDTCWSAPLLKPEVPVRINCTVTKNGIRAAADGRTFIDWSGDSRRLSIYGDSSLPDSRRLFLGARNHFKFRDIKLGPPLPPPAQPEHPPLAVGKSVDLLPLIDLKRDALGGTWEREGNSLLCRGDVQHNKLALPLDLPIEYKLSVRVARVDGGTRNNDSLIFGLPTEHSTAVLSIDGYASTITAPYLDYNDLPAFAQPYKGSVIPAGMTCEIEVFVRKTGLQVTSNGAIVLDWKGNLARCWLPSTWARPGRGLLIGSWNQGFRFDKLQLEPLPPGSSFPIDQLGSDGNLLPIINVERDSRKGDWKREGDGLVTPSVQACRLRIPVPLPAKYLFSASVERKLGDSDLYLGLVVGGHPCSVSIDGGNQHQAGIDLVDGKRFFDKANLTNRKYSEPMLPMGQPVTVRCYVLPDSIVVQCGDKELIRWHGDPRRLSAPRDYDPPNYSEDDRNHLWLSAWVSQFVFRDLELRPLSDFEADQLSKSFSGVFPTTSQSEVPLKPITPGSLLPLGGQ